MSITPNQIKHALQASSNVLRQDPWQLPSQLSVALAGDTTSDEFSGTIQQHTNHPWLAPKSFVHLASARALVGSCEGAGEVLNLSVSPDGRIAVTEAFLEGVTVWNLKTGARLNHFDPPVWQVNDSERSQQFGRMVFADDNTRLFSATQHGGVCVFDLIAMNIVETHWNSLLSGRAIKLTRDGRHAICVPRDGKDYPVVRWDLEDWSCEGVLAAEHIADRPSCFTVDGHWLLSYSDDGELVICCTVDASRSARYSGFPTSLHGPLALASTHRYLFAIDERLQVVRVDLQANTIKTLPGQDGHKIRGSSQQRPESITDLKLSDDETYLVMAYASGRLGVWSNPCGNEQSTGLAIAHDDGFTCADRIYANNRLTTASRGGVIKTWDLAAVVGVEDGFEYGSRIEDLVFVRDDEAVLACARRGLTLWSVATGALLDHEFPAYLDINCLHRVPESGLVAAGGLDGHVYLLDANTLTVRDSWKAHDEGLSGFAASADGRQLVTSSYGTEVHAWEISTRRCVASLDEHTQAVRKLALSPVDDEIVATAGWEETTTIWNRATGAIVARLHGHDGPVRDALFVMNGTLLATSSWDGIILWDCSDWSQIGALVGHRDIIECLTPGLSPNQLVSYSNDRTVRIWDLETFTPVIVYTHDSSVIVGRPSAKQHCLCIGDAYGRVTLFEPRGLDTPSPYLSEGSALGTPSVAPAIRTKYMP